MATTSPMHNNYGSSSFTLYIKHARHLHKGSPSSGDETTCTVESRNYAPFVHASIGQTREGAYSQDSDIYT